MDAKANPDRETIARLLQGCIAAHDPHPASVELGLADVRFALLRSGACVRVLSDFDSKSERLKREGGL